MRFLRKRGKWARNCLTLRCCSNLQKITFCVHGPLIGEKRRRQSVRNLEQPTARKTTATVPAAHRPRCIYGGRCSREGALSALLAISMLDFTDYSTDVRRRVRSRVSVCSNARRQHNRGWANFSGWYYYARLCFPFHLPCLEARGFWNLKPNSR